MILWITLTKLAQLPAPPKSHSIFPFVFNALCAFFKSRLWSFTQCKAALEKIRSNSFSKFILFMSICAKFRLFLWIIPAVSIMWREASIPSTFPRGTNNANCSVRIPSPHPRSSIVSFPLNENSEIRSFPHSFWCFEAVCISLRQIRMYPCKIPYSDMFYWIILLYII